ncbi:MAG: aminoacyl--tRNA ligase-related protein [Candidatus Gracilibacteria bacterium]|nr:aminoacyl--tRNA ligase-related protein [Candidatus Gracilibacteria bacterium]MDQ7022911.1 aminoacyl--tRNA ligase-related protein [Candidatus Gracilibacteria bacterium]
MIKLSKFPFKTQKSIPNGSDNKSTGILLQAGFIRQTMAGVYTYTTFGLKVLRKIEKIVREEMDNYGAFETLMPALSPKELWDKTGRWDTIDVMFHLPAANKKEYGLNSTHEELITPLMGDFIQSYKDLPVCAYQIQNKFRNEKRAKSGLLRGREFIMKDAYSFHSSDEDFEKYYEGMKEVYLSIFKKLGLGDDTVIALADGGTFTTKFSHEFQVKIDIGEDIIYKCRECGICHNEEIVDLVNGFKCSSCKSNSFEKFNASEIGNIFPLETKFTSAFGIQYLGEDNKMQTPLMGCYGIGVSRAMGLIAEKFVTDKGINWPESVAPAKYYIAVIGEENLEKALDLIEKLNLDKSEIILDDRFSRKIGFGQKMGDAELLGIPNKIVISKKTIEENSYELNGKLIKI